MDLAQTEEIKALLRKAEEARGCLGPDVSFGARELLAPSLALCVHFSSQIIVCTSPRDRRPAARHVAPRGSRLGND